MCLYPRLTISCEFWITFFQPGNSNTDNTANFSPQYLSNDNMEEQILNVCSVPLITDNYGGGKGLGVSFV